MLKEQENGAEGLQLVGKCVLPLTCVVPGCWAVNRDSDWAIPWGPTLAPPLTETTADRPRPGYCQAAALLPSGPAR